MERHHAVRVAGCGVVRGRERTLRMFAFAELRGVWTIPAVSEWLVEFQSKIAEYPLWLVVGVGLVIVAGLLFSLGKVFRVVGAVVLIGAIGAAGWLAYQHYFAGG